VLSTSAFCTSLFALKGRDVIAQGNALGLGHQAFPRALKGNAVTDFFGAFKHKNCSILRISLCDLAGIGRKPTLSLNLERCGICENARFPE
jgi:hypothetical protein